MVCCFAATRDGLDKTIQHTIDGSYAPGLFPLISIPTIVGCIGALLIIIAAIATPIAKTQKMREVWFYDVGRCGVKDRDDGDRADCFLKRKGSVLFP